MNTDVFFSVVKVSVFRSEIRTLRMKKMTVFSYKTFSMYDSMHWVVFVRIFPEIMLYLLYHQER
jgi:hypothetical protein